MAPEQVNIALGEIGPWTDVYALGALLYEFLAGAPPYRGATSIEIYTQLMEGVPAPTLRSKLPGVDPRLEAICARCMANDPKAPWCAT